MTLLVTGGAGFIGSNFVIQHLKSSNETVINLDLLTYAGHLANLEPVQSDPRHIFVHGDIANKSLLEQLFNSHDIRAVVHFAAESHVDRSIQGPMAFVQTNVVGTATLLEATRQYLNSQPAHKKEIFRFLHVSTDEVYGSLGPTDPAFTEEHPYAPNSPYSASKAASDHAVRAYHHTYGLPTIITHCSNNYGPRHFPEKLIPLAISHALKKQMIPIYGDGQNIRDWLYVADHVRALIQILARGRVGDVYNIGGNQEKTNLDVVETICDLLDELSPRPDTQSYRTQIQFVPDRPGHDRRYAINANKLKNELGWVPRETFETGIMKTIQWLLSHPTWIEAVTQGIFGESDENTVTG